MHKTHTKTHTTAAMMICSIRGVSIARRRLPRWVSFATRSMTQYSDDATGGIHGRGERLRVAVVGGGVAGMSAALHLANLVSQGLISGPIDIYEASGHQGRDVGVGVWSTALSHFEGSDRESHQLVYQDLIRRGTFVKGVGYRTPQGHWLAESNLESDDLPQLLFLREKDLIMSLRKAVHLEEQRGTLAMQSGARYRIGSIFDQCTEPWSAPLMLPANSTTEPSSQILVRTPRDYHLIIDGSGSHSALRKTYGGYRLKGSETRITGTTALQSPLDIPTGPASARKDQESWDDISQGEATRVQDRRYTVFRGNAKLSMEEMIDLDEKNKGNHVSFQTWGEGRSMRFATVPMLHPSGIAGKEEERQVWFITIDDKELEDIDDPVTRRDRLLESFTGWHNPVRQLVEATDPEEIIMDHAVAHKHCMGPVTNFNEVVKKITKRPPPNGGTGPAIVFVGDAFMCIDPILAQGFTMGMEGAAVLAESIEATTKAPRRQEYPDLAFDPYALRKELETRHERRLGRLICLLRATELVQALGQPTTGTLLGFLSRDILRPLMRFTPDVIKTPLFNNMLKYSLGVHKSDSVGIHKGGIKRQ